MVGEDQILFILRNTAAAFPKRHLTSTSASPSWEITLPSSVSQLVCRSIKFCQPSCHLFSPFPINLLILHQESCVWVISSSPPHTTPDRMTRPAFDPADSDLFERQEAALSIWTEKLKEKQRLFAEREHIFEGTRLALGGPRRRRVPPPAASPAPEHLPRRVGASRRASAAPPLAAPLLTHTPAASFAGPPISPRRSGYASHLGSMEATAPEAQLSTPAASSSRRKQRTRRHSMDHFKQLPTVQSKTVNSGGRKTRTIPDSPASITHPVTISTPITQPFPTSTVTQIRPPSSAGSPPQTTRAQPTPTPVPAPRRRAAATQSTSTPAPVSRVGVTGVQPPPVPVPAPRLRGARTQTDLPKSVEELAPPPVSSPLHPPPDPAFHALALSLVRLAEVSPAQAPALLAQAAVLSPSVIQSLAHPLATPTPAQPLASPTSVHPLPAPVQSVQPAPVQSTPLQSPPALQSPVAQSPPALQSPVAQSPPALQSPVAQSPVVQSSVLSPSVVHFPTQSSAQSPLVQLAQSLIHHPFQFPNPKPQHPEPAGFPHPLARPLLSQGFPRPLAPPVSSQRPPRPLAPPVSSQRPPCPLLRRLVRPLLQLLRRLVRPLLQLLRRLVRPLLQLHRRLVRPRPQPRLQLCLRLVQLLPRRRPSHVLDVNAAAVFLAAAHRTCSVAAAVFLAAAHRTCSVAAAVFLAAAHQINSSITAGHVAAHRNCFRSATGHVAARLTCLCLDSVPPSWAPSALPVLVFRSFGRRVPAFEGGGFLLIGAGLALTYRRIKKAEPAVQTPTRLPAGIETMGRGVSFSKWVIECSTDEILENRTAANLLFDHKNDNITGVNAAPASQRLRRHPALSSLCRKQQVHLANGGRPYSQQMGDRKPLGAYNIPNMCWLMSGQHE
ncbi:hypothetical protein ACER0C_007285 [Sarotherodon galilaeus]